MDSKVKAVIAVNCAALLFGGTALFPKLLPFNSNIVIFGRTIFAAIALVSFILVSKSDFKINVKPDGFFLVSSGTLLALHWMSYFHAIQISNVATGVVACFTYPVITTFLEPFFFNERLLLEDVVLAGVVTVGIYIIIPVPDFSNNITRGVFWGVLSATLFSIRNLLERKYLLHISGSVSLFYQIVVVFFFLLPTMDFDQNYETVHFVYWLLLGSIFTALPHALFTSSIRVLKAKTVSIICSPQPLYATILAAAVLSELPSVQTAIGGILVIGCAFYESLRSRK